MDSKPVVLIVDDDRALQRVLADAVSEAGFGVVVEKDGEWALKSLASRKVDVVLLDVLLPGMGGYEVAKRIRALPGGDAIALLFISGVYKNPVQRKEALEKHKAVAFLDKPLRPEQLRTALKQALGARYPDPAAAKADRKRMEGTDPGVLADQSARDEASAVERVVKSPAPAPMVASGGSQAGMSRPISGGAPLLRGNLDQQPFPRVLSELHRRKVSGALLLRREKVKKIVFFREGQPYFIKSNLLSECLGRVLVREKMISESDCEDSLVRMKRSGRQQGTVLVEMGLLSPPNLQYALTLQLQVKLFDVFSWQEGDFQFNGQVDLPEATTSIELTSAATIVKGVERGYEASRIAQLLKPFERAFPTAAEDPLLRFQDAGLLDEQQALLDGCDGSATTRELMNAGHVPPEEAARLLLGLDYAGMISFAAERAAKPTPKLPPRTVVPWEESEEELEALANRTHGDEDDETNAAGELPYEIEEDEEAPPPPARPPTPTAIARVPARPPTVPPPPPAAARLDQRPTAPEIPVVKVPPRPAPSVPPAPPPAAAKPAAPPPPPAATPAPAPAAEPPRPAGFAALLASVQGTPSLPPPNKRLAPPPPPTEAITGAVELPAKNPWAEEESTAAAELPVGGPGAQPVDDDDDEPTASAELPRAPRPSMSDDEAEESTSAADPFAQVATSASALDDGLGASTVVDQAAYVPGAERPTAVEMQAVVPPPAPPAKGRKSERSGKGSRPTGARETVPRMPPPPGPAAAVAPPPAPAAAPPPVEPPPPPVDDWDPPPPDAPLAAPSSEARPGALRRDRERERDKGFRSERESHSGRIAKPLGTPKGNAETRPRVEAAAPEAAPATATLSWEAPPAAEVERPGRIARPLPPVQRTDEPLPAARPTEKAPPAEKPAAARPPPAPAEPPAAVEPPPVERPAPSPAAAPIALPKPKVKGKPSEKGADKGAARSERVTPPDRPAAAAAAKPVSESKAQTAPVELKAPPPAERSSSLLPEIGWEAPPAPAVEGPVRKEARPSTAAPPPLPARQGPPPLPKKGEGGGFVPPPLPKKGAAVTARSAGSLLPELSVVMSRIGLTHQERELRETLGAKVAELKKLDWFQVLGVSPDVEADALKQAYLQLVREFHPDRAYKSASAEVRALANEVYQLVTTAYDTLKDPVQRDRVAADLAKGIKKDVSDQVQRIVAAEGRFQKGEEALRRKAFGEALAFFEEAVGLYDQEGEFQAYLGWALFQTAPRDPETADRAVERLEHAIKLNPRVDRSYLFLGYLHKAQGRADKAERQFEKAIQVNPDCTEALRELRLLGKGKR